MQKCNLKTKKEERARYKFTIKTRKTYRVKYYLFFIADQWFGWRQFQKLKEFLGLDGIFE